MPRALYLCAFVVEYTCSQRFYSGSSGWVVGLFRSFWGFLGIPAAASVSKSGTRGPEHSIEATTVGFVTELASECGKTCEDSEP